MGEVTIKCSESQLWIILRALVLLTSPYGEGVLRAGYPHMDVDALSRDIEDLEKRLEAAAEHG